jgi:hypothetical protein
VKANQGAAGIDAETIKRFEEKLGDLPASDLHDDPIDRRLRETPIRS